MKRYSTPKQLFVYYKVTVITVDKIKVYHVVNCETNITHSNWRSLEEAMRVMRDLNSMERRKLIKVVA